MAGWLGMYVMKFLENRRKAHWISEGLRPTMINLDDGMTSMHCWVPKTGKSADPECRGGNDKPALVLIHGFGADGQATWYRQAFALAKHYRLYIPDLVFFGQSTSTSVDERSEIFQAECIKNMLEKFGVENVNVVGHSYGGFVAFWMAQKYPRFVSRVIIVSSALCMTPSTNVSLLQDCGAADIKEVLLPSTVRDLRRGMELTIYRLRWLPDFVYRYMLQSSGDTKRKAELLDGMLTGSATSPSLPLLNQNVLIIWGENDRIFKVEEAHRLQMHLGEQVVRLEVLKQTGHVPPVEKPDEFNRLVLEFLNQ